MNDARAPLVETDEVTALREDYARLRAAFAEALAEERQLRAQPSASDPGPSTTGPMEQHLAVELARVQEDLDRVLRSPTWKVGSAATALPRWIRDRRNR